jgi:hypothetical protein
MSDLSPLSGVKRKLDLVAIRSGYDPERTFLSLERLPTDGRQLVTDHHGFQRDLGDYPRLDVALSHLR